MTLDPTPPGALATALVAARDHAVHAGDGIVVVAVRAHHHPLVLHQKVDGLNEAAAFAVGAAADAAAVVIVVAPPLRSPRAIHAADAIYEQLTTAEIPVEALIYTPSLQEGTAWTNLRPTSGDLPTGLVPSARTSRAPTARRRVFRGRWLTAAGQR
ncbi:hypothetical protein ACQP2U_43175 (plasmid) [Nocardia sp. CA-084685]|uniref:hypothetical protein n=1 Tax=Nocardia sp. CA-084685 TaxID=3239970 RepID=UPI003D97B9BE